MLRLLRRAYHVDTKEQTHGVVAAIAVIGFEGRLDTSWDGKPARELALCVQKLSRRLGARPHLFA